MELQPDNGIAACMVAFLLVCFGPEAAVGGCIGVAIVHSICLLDCKR